jgi:hypothetical protein
MEDADSVNAFEKNIQGMIPEKINKGKLRISTLKTQVKTNVMTDMIKKGLIKEEYIPEKDDAYRALSCEIAISQSVCR